jgi:hypothetical protein
MGLVAVCGSVPSLAVEGTATFREAAEIQAGDGASPVGPHAVTRLVDWNGDRQPDLLVGDRRGAVWIFVADADSPTAWKKAQRVIVDGRELALAAANTTACFVDFSGDGLSDLVLAHDDRHLSWARNVGRVGEPAFAAPVELLNAAGEPLLPKGCGARIDVGDWDGDGRPDLVAGHFSGNVLWYRNTGTPQAPSFTSEPAPLCVDHVPRKFSYNVHPTLFDLNQDGRLDVVYGINWGTIGCFLATAKPDDRAAFNFERELSLASTSGPLNLRATAGDDTTPTFGDIDGDGTLDLVTGGEQGRLWRLAGTPLRATLDEVRTMLAAPLSEFNQRLKDDAEFRGRLIGRLHGLYAHCEGFAVTPAARKPLADWLQQQFDEHPQLLRHAQHSVEDEPYVPWLAYQFWTLRMRCHDGDPDARDHRLRVAESIGFTGKLKEILGDFGTLVIENGRATANQQRTLYSYLSQIPPILLGDRSIGKVTEVITIADYLGPKLEVRNAGGVNIFATDSGKPGSSENPFPKDFPGVENDYFGVVLAHELNHRVDATRFVAVPKYNEQYWRHMRKSCGKDVAFAEPVTAGVDWEKTKQQFQAVQLWNGESAAWDKAWEEYWLTGPGAARVLNVCRNRTTYRVPRYGIPFFLETRQESIASLANQYFSDSAHMFHFALDRFRRGASGALDEWLLMADVYSLDGPTTLLYKHANGEVDLRRSTAPLERDEHGHIRAVTVAGEKYEFELDAEGLVERVFRTTRGREELESR